MQTLSSLVALHVNILSPEVSHNSFFPFNLSVSAPSLSMSPVHSIIIRLKFTDENYLLQNIDKLKTSEPREWNVEDLISMPPDPNNVLKLLTVNIHSVNCNFDAVLTLILRTRIEPEFYDIYRMLAFLLPGEYSGFERIFISCILWQLQSKWWGNSVCKENNIVFYYWTQFPRNELFDYQGCRSYWNNYNFIYIVLSSMFVPFEFLEYYSEIAVIFWDSYFKQWY